jgi:hypothetical protein
MTILAKTDDAAAAVDAPESIGKSVGRREDERLLTGYGRVGIIGKSSPRSCAVRTAITRPMD